MRMLCVLVRVRPLRVLLYVAHVCACACMCRAREYAHAHKHICPFFAFARRIVTQHKTIAGGSKVISVSWYCTRTCTRVNTNMNTYMLTHTDTHHTRTHTLSLIRTH
eukprot:Tamp_30509.p3 GENE.Tamp_30509~~Tamp_30509.p3  ORF type:complete len:107 (-),score=2.91 Tamp_30509:277-597(-)